MSQKIKSYWNRELLPILLKDDKVYFHKVLKIISEKYVSSIFGVANFLNGFIVLSKDETLDVDDFNRLTDFVCTLFNMDFLGYSRHKIETRLVGHASKFDFYLHVSEKDYAIIYKVNWDTEYFREMMESQDELIKKYEDSFLFFKVKSEIDEPPLFYLNDVFTKEEAACLVSGDNPIDIVNSKDSQNFDYDFKKFKEAYNFISAAITSETLCSEPIISQELKIFLSKKGKLIKGFNDQIESKTMDLFGQDTGIDFLPLSHYQKERDELLKQKEKLIDELRQKEGLLEKKAETSNSSLLLNSALMNMLRNEIKIKSLKTQSKILQKIEDENTELKGLSKSSTEKIMAIANKLLKTLKNN